jgi:hypothetical protein
LNAVTVVCVTQKLVCVLVSRATKGMRVRFLLFNFYRYQYYSTWDTSGI